MEVRTLSPAIQAAIERAAIARAADLAACVLKATETAPWRAYEEQTSALHAGLAEAFPPAAQGDLANFFVKHGYGHLNNVIPRGTQWHHVPRKIVEVLTSGALQGGFGHFIRKAVEAKPGSAKLLGVLTPLVPTEGLRTFLYGLTEEEFAAVVIAAFDRRKLDYLKCLMSRTVAVDDLMRSARSNAMEFARLLHIYLGATKNAS